MAVRKGGELIAEFLVKEKIPYVFGICGHGNVGLLDSALRRQGQGEARLAAPRADGRAHGRRLLPREAPAGRDADLDRPGIGEPHHGAGRRADGLVRVFSRSPRTCRHRSSTAGRSRSSTATTRPISPTSSSPVVKRSFQPTRVDMLPLALRQAFDTMTSGPPGPGQSRRAV